MTPLTPQQLNCLAPGSMRLEGSADGPLAGTTFSCKDMFAIAGHTSSFGHPRRRETHSPSPSTAPAIEALLGAGATMIGLAKLDARRGGREPRRRPSRSEGGGRLAARLGERLRGFGAVAQRSH